jgi:PAS domain-containing protein
MPNGSDADLADLAGRRDALRQAAVMPGADPPALLGAAFAELDAAVEALTKLTEAAAGSPAATPEALNAERALLRAVFQHAPVPLFVLEQDATVRRANARAGDLIGAPPGYATGKALTAFVDLPFRAAVTSQFAAAARTGKARQVECRLLGPDGPVDAVLTAGVIAPLDGTRLLVVSAAGPGGERGGRGGLGGKASPQDRGGPRGGRPPGR